MITFGEILLVGAGGSIGACLRFLLSGALPPIRGLPAGTLAVNILGTTILSFLVFSSISMEIIYPITVGVLGSFTTFSTFAYESFHLLEEGSSNLFITNMASNIIFCFIGTGVGWLLAVLI